MLKKLNWKNADFKDDPVEIYIITLPGEGSWPFQKT